MGLYLLVTTDGGKEWHFEYQLAGVAKDFHFGYFPEHSLSFARDFALAANDLVQSNRDPSCIDKKELILLHASQKYGANHELYMPSWMAKAVADKFKQYYSRKILCNENITLDSIFKITGIKKQEEFDYYSIDTTKCVYKTRKIQWYTGLRFATACSYAILLLQLEPQKRGDITDDHQLKLSHPSCETLCQEESRGKYGTYAAWCKRNKTPLHANTLQQDSFFDYLDAFGPKHNLRKKIIADMQDKRKCMTP